MAKKKQQDELLDRARAASERAARMLPVSGEADPQSAILNPQSFPAWLITASPHYTWDWPHQLHLYGYLNQVTRAEIDRLIITLPPRHGKSVLSTIHYAAWRIVQDPTCRVIVGAYAQKLARKFSRMIRRLVQHYVALSEDVNTADEWETHAGGGVLAVGRGAGVTGYGANLIILDDTVKNRAEAESDTYRESTWEWYGSDIYTRQEPGCQILVTNTRWHGDDLTGRLLEEEAEGGDHWEIVNLPALAESGDPLGRDVGEALCPARFDVAALARIQARMSPYDFAALYQQSPVPNEGAVFKVDWFKIEPKAPDGLRWVRGYDLAVSTQESADFTASIAVACDREGNLWLRDALRGRWEWPEARRKIKDLMQRERSVTHGFEAVAFQLAAIQELRRERTLLNVPFRGVKVTRDKLSRALPWAERAAEGKVYLVRGSWVNEFLTEVAHFPKVKHDDQIDAVSLAVEMLARWRGGRVVLA